MGMRTCRQAYPLGRDLCASSRALNSIPVRFVVLVVVGVILGLGHPY